MNQALTILTIVALLLGTVQPQTNVVCVFGPCEETEPIPHCSNRSRDICRACEDEYTLVNN